jgi:3-hydroxyacyl-[acyl-carrier-protein] dehydratase
MQSDSIVIPADHPSFPGHFPGQPILPGVLILQRVMAFASQQLGFAPTQYTIQNAKFLASVGPGDHLIIELTRQQDSHYSFTVHAMRSDHSNRRLACTVQLRWGG